MSTALSISDVGLRLIKAYEGFRPVDIELISGQRVAGYGHRVMGGRSLHLSESEAEQLLKRDLAPFEAMINDHIFAPLTQSQFDALCSLAYNIGPKKFLESDVVRALNNGRVLDAANGFDVWRMGRINGETYIVDALVRRRTAEKVLFLRPALVSAKAPRIDLEAAADSDMQGASTAAPAPILEDSGLVSPVNYPAKSNAADADKPMADASKVPAKDRRKKTNADPAVLTPMRRRDDRPGGVLTLSEVFEDDEGTPDPIVDEIGGFMSDLKASVAPDDMFEDTPGDVAASKLSPDKPLELDDIVEYDDTVLPDGLPDNVPDNMIETDVPSDTVLELKDTVTDEPDFDPSDYIVGDSVKSLRANDVDGGDVLELTGEDEAPSPIATAAAEVSGRLDALMADETAQAPEEPKNILPFRNKRAEKLASTKPAPSEPVPSKPVKPIKRGKNSPLYASLIAPKDAEDNLDNKFADGTETTREDSASRYIAKAATSEPKPKKTALGFMVIAGMTILGASIGAILSGWDQRYGAGGEFLSTTGALLGLMITLGSIYYILKKPAVTHNQ